MIADACPVCGAELWCTLPSGEAVFECGKGPGEACLKAERVAIERAAEVTRLRAALELIANAELSARHCEDLARETLTEKPNQEK